MKALFAAALSAFALAGPAAAQEGEEVPVEEVSQEGGGSALGLDIGGEALLLSDYRFRGISRSGEDPAVQGQLTVSVPSGLYAGARATSLGDAGALGSAQVEAYAGYGTELSLATSLDAGLLYYWFPDGSGATDYLEPYASISHRLGPVEGTLGAKYAWSQAALGGEDMLYLFGEAEAGIPTTPLTLTAQAGRQEAGALGSYWNWSVGGRYARGPLEAGLRYVDTDLAPLPGQDSGLVFSLGFRF